MLVSEEYEEANITEPLFKMFASYYPTIEPNTFQ